MRFLSTSPLHLLDKRSNPFRLNIWTVVVPLVLVALASAVVFVLASVLPRFANKTEGPIPHAQAPAVDQSKEILALKNNMARVRLAGLLYTKDHENAPARSLEPLIGSYLRGIPPIPGFITDKSPATAWEFKGDAVHVKGVKDGACRLINGGGIFAAPRTNNQFYCFGAKAPYTAVFQQGDDRKAVSGYRLVTATFSLELLDGVAAVNLQLAGEQNSFVEACPTGAHIAPRTTQNSAWLTHPGNSEGKYTERFCIPASEGGVTAFKAGDTSAQGVSSLSKTISVAGDDWTLFVAGYAIPGCLTSPDNMSVVYTAGVAKGKTDKVRLPKGCLPEAEHPLN